MLGRHQSELMTVLEAVHERGWGLIERWKLYLWYDAKKLRKEPYRDISAKWEEVSGGAILRVADTEDGLLLLSKKTDPISART
jgi:hypothetical protein